MKPAEYKARYRQTLKALFGSLAGMQQFFVLHPTWKPLMRQAARQGFHERIAPDEAACQWFDAKVLPQLGDDALTLEAQTLATTRKKGTP